jgi:hypothetical protein
MPLIVLFLSLLLSSQAEAAAKTCKVLGAQKKLEEGVALQKELESTRALKAYDECLQADPGCVPCRYERGWSNWRLGDWAAVVADWDAVLGADATHPDALQYLPTAKENLAMVKAKKIPKSFQSGVEIGSRSEPADGPVTLLLLGRRESYNPNPSHPMDHFDTDIYSPKSVHFTKDGKKVYVNSLEGGKTVIYDALGIEKLGVIQHKFTDLDKSLFQGTKAPWGYQFHKEVKKPNEFLGKPVEIEDSHNGRYLWIPYYRRTFDANGSQPSAMAIVDTTTDKIVRVMATGPISKYVRRSNTGRWMAVSHWGDNTVGLFDIRGNVQDFKAEHLLTVEKRIDPKNLTGDRDRNCGFCVRGLAFSADDRYLFVSRMKGGGIAVFRLEPKTKTPPFYLGTVFGIVPGPRDLEMARDGSLFVSCNASGVVARVTASDIVKKLEALPEATPYEKRRITVKPSDLGVKSAYVGLGARSIRLSHNEKTLFVTVNQTSELVGVDTKAMAMAARIPVDSYPVGLDLSPDDSQVWITSQGRDAKGGNSVEIFQVRYKNQEIVPSQFKRP